MPSPSLPPSLPSSLPLASKHVLVFIDRGKIVRIIGIRRTASRAKLVQVLLDVIPAVAADLRRGREGGREGGEVRR